MEVEDDDYKKGMEELKCTVVGRLFIQKGEITPITLELKVKLQNTWAMNNLKLVPLRRGVFYVLVYSMEEQSLSMEFRTIYTKPGTLRVSRWYLGFNQKNHVQTKAQVCVKFFICPL